MDQASRRSCRDSGFCGLVRVEMRSAHRRVGRGVDHPPMSRPSVSSPVQFVRLSRCSICVKIVRGGDDSIPRDGKRRSCRDCVSAWATRDVSSGISAQKETVVGDAIRSKRVVLTSVVVFRDASAVTIYGRHRDRGGDGHHAAWSLACDHNTTC